MPTGNLTIITRNAHGNGRKGTMRMEKSKRINKWLLPTILILFILEIITLPLMVILTYAGRSESPEHLLTFADQKLTWDENTVVHADGVAELSFFSQFYQNVNSENRDDVFAPGTEKLTVIRLKNDSSKPAKYTAIAYMIKESDELMLIGSMQAQGAAPTENYLLPEGVTRDQVLDALTGTVDSKAIQDFDIDWRWGFERGEEIEPGIYESDSIDTYLGNKAAWDVADDATIGFYIVIEGDDGPIAPNPPSTGAGSMLWWSIVLIAISAIILAFAVIMRVHERRCNKRSAL